MDIYGKIAQKVKEIASKNGLGTSIFPAKVTAVSGNTCTVDIGGLAIADVRLKAVVDNNTNQVIILPKKDSHVLVADLSGGNYRQLAVISYSEVEKVSIKISETTISVDKNGIVLNGGTSGAVDIVKLISWMSSVKTDLTTISTSLSGLLGGAPVPVTTPTPEKANFEDNKLKH